MYKAIKEIGGYNIGDEVPTDKAKVWLSMYAVPHVEEVSGKSTEKVEEVKVEETVTSDNSGSSILEDYLGRSSNVVKKNVTEDKLSDNQLKELLKLEKSDKNRSAVIFAIKKRLAN